MVNVRGGVIKSKTFKLVLMFPSITQKYEENIQS